MDSVTGDLSTGAGVECRLFSSWEEVERYAAQWDALCERAGGDIYSTFDWCRTWWEFYGRHRRLEIRLVFEGGILTAVFPFFRETLRVGGLPVTLVRVVGCDFGMVPGNPVVARGAEDAAVKALAESLRRDTRWDLIHIGLLSGCSKPRPEVIDAFRRHFSDMDFQYFDDVGGDVVFDLEDTFDAFMNRISKDRRSPIQRAEKELSRKHKVEHAVHVDADDLTRAFEDFLVAHERLWRARGMRGYFNEWPRAKDFHRALIERLAPGGRVFMTELIVDGSTVAGCYCHRYGDLVHSFQACRDDAREWRKYGVGNIRLFRMVEYAIRTGARMVDMGGRPIEHKLQLGGRLVTKKLLLVRKRGLHARLRLWLFRAASFVLDKAYDGLWYRRIARWIGATGSPYWSTWIRSRVPLPGASGRCKDTLEGSE